MRTYFESQERDKNGIWAPTSSWVISERAIRVDHNSEGAAIRQPSERITTEMRFAVGLEIATSSKVFPALHPNRTSRFWCMAHFTARVPSCHRDLFQPISNILCERRARPNPNRHACCSAKPLRILKVALATASSTPSLPKMRMQSKPKSIGYHVAAKAR